MNGLFLFLYPLPMKYNLARDITINASVDKVLPHITDFHKWKQWSPWSNCEPDHKQTIEGEAGKIGHKMRWDGEIIGSGEMVLEDMTDTTMSYDLQFFKPFKSKAKTKFIVEKLSENETKVTWTMDSSMPFFLFFMVKMMKSWIEMDYDRGLIMLKDMVEVGKIEATTTNEGIVPFEGFSYIGIQKTSTMENMPKEMEACFDKLMNDFKSKGKNAQKWICVYPKVDMANKMFTYICAASDEQLDGESLGDEYIKGNIATGNVFKVSHHGSYKFLGNAWSMGMMYVRGKKMKQTGKPFEFYHNSPHDTDEKDLRTDICFPVK